jgi:hypothetical protein
MSGRFRFRLEFDDFRRFRRRRHDGLLRRLTYRRLFFVESDFIDFDGIVVVVESEKFVDIVKVFEEKGNRRIGMATILCNFFAVGRNKLACFNVRKFLRLSP